MTSRNDTWGAIVVRPAVTYWARAPHNTLAATTPDWALTDLQRVVLAAGSLYFRSKGEGTVLWQCGKVDTRRMVDDLRAADWSVSDSGHETGWFTVRRAGYAVVHLGIGELITQSRFPLCPLDAETARLALDLVRYADLTGAAWRGTAGMSGCAQIRTIHGTKPEGAQPLWRWDDAKAAGAIRSSWELRGARNRRAITAEELERAWVYQFDVRAMYCAAANVAMLGWSAPEARGPQEFDPGRPGYWRVRREEIGAAPEELVRPGEGPLVWLTTPVMSYLAENGFSPEVMDSWTSERGGRYLKGWSERLTAALRAVEPADPELPSVERALKETYKRTVGLFAREGGRIYRPDWRDEIVDRARVNLLRKVRRARLRPLRWNVDSVWIASDEPAELVGHALGVAYHPDGREVWQIGKFRLVGQLPPAEYVARFERNRVAA